MCFLMEMLDVQISPFLCPVKVVFPDLPGLQGSYKSTSAEELP